MILSSETSKPEIKNIFSLLLSGQICDVESIGSGRNSRVFKLECIDGRKYVGKIYFQSNSDTRDRLGTEFLSLKFLWENGIRNIPKPVSYSRSDSCAIYEYIDGERIHAEGVNSSDINAATCFIRELKGLKNANGSSDIRDASEACFSVNAIIRSIQNRLEVLRSINEDTEAHEDLRTFLSERFIPLFSEIGAWSEARSKKVGISFDEELDLEEKTLSPSDFGFHNALRIKAGHIVFLDFEYFGWDDPAKMISDFLFHPAMQLSKELKEQFVANILDSFKEYKYLSKRVEIVYPLFGLKWCMILLNEFVPEHLNRRGFASKNGVDKIKLQSDQLGKTAQLLDKIGRNYERFPHYC